MKRDLAVTRKLGVLETARFYALADFAGTNGNPATTADPGWTPLVVTPPNPDYPSGHTCRTAAQMTAHDSLHPDAVAFAVGEE